MIPSRRPRAAAVVAAATAAVLGLGLAGGVALAPLVTGTAAETRPGAVDVGFSQDMIVHHEQAVVMAQLVRGRTADPTVAAVAAGIEGDQLIEIGQLRGFLVL